MLICVTVAVDHICGIVILYVLSRRVLVSVADNFHRHIDVL